MPELRVIDVIFTRDGPTFTVKSPQLPGFIGGRSSLKQLEADYRGMLEFAGVDLEVTRFRLHSEEILPSIDDEVVVRWARDSHMTERIATLDRLIAAINDAAQREAMLDIPRATTGEALFIAALPGDTIKWVAEQLLASGDSAAVIVSVGDTLIWTTYFSVGDQEQELPTVSDLGLGMEATLSDIMTRQPIGQDRHRLLIQAGAA